MCHFWYNWVVAGLFFLNKPWANFAKSATRKSAPKTHFWPAIGGLSGNKFRNVAAPIGFVSLKSILSLFASRHWGDFDMLG